MEIVENRRGQLSGPFLSHGDNFSKKYDENQIWSERHGQISLGAKSVKIPCLTAATQLPYKSGFRHNFSKIYPQDLKMVQKDAPRDCLQSPLKITC